ncbi:DUF2799 domain-containing protein [Enterobacteriaceae bacterium RIT691]|nr:DUF2799 domain-containing protein [Enterobacteriaceae bacterium RIT691]
MKPVLCALVLLLLSGCKLDPYADVPKGKTDWYGEGIDDGRSGISARSEQTLARDLEDPKVDQTAYLKGYAVGLEDICQAHLLYGWGVTGKMFPEGCDSKANAAALREAWNAGAKEGAQSTSFR